jgi:geranylgeranyl diphosphate synthase, type II
MHSISHYQELINNYFLELSLQKEPKNLYEPINYILHLGGKRIRPVLTLMAAESFDVDCCKALPAATAIEVFHNFSLVHDDIMDDAPLRRGNETVHEKWNINTGILSGDAMLILAYQHFEEYEPIIFRDLAKLFSKTALEVCEGQQYDVDFETRDDVTMGAIVAKTSQENADLIYEFGLNLGIAFQLQDDYLDAFGDPETFGKQVGGDIIENKKTHLYLKAIEFANLDEREQLLHLFSVQPKDNYDKVNSVKEIFNSTGSSVATQKAIQDYTNKALDTLDKMNISADKKNILKNFGQNLMNRNV